MHVIYYDDGESKAHNLNEDQWELLEPIEERRKAPRVARAVKMIHKRIWRNGEELLQVSFDDGSEEREFVPVASVAPEAVKTFEQRKEEERCEAEGVSRSKENHQAPTATPKASPAAPTAALLRLFGGRCDAAAGASAETANGTSAIVAAFNIARQDAIRPSGSSTPAATAARARPQQPTPPARITVDDADGEKQAGRAAVHTPSTEDVRRPDDSSVGSCEPLATPVESMVLSEAESMAMRPTQKESGVDMREATVALAGSAVQAPSTLPFPGHHQPSPQ